MPEIKLEMGDVLLVVDGGFAQTKRLGLRKGFDGTHFLITAGQAVGTHQIGSSSNVTHAGLCDGGGSILEASGGEGLRSADFVIKHLGTKYQVYRYKGNPRIPEDAVNWAMKFIAHRGDETNPDKGFGQYSLRGAVRSIFSCSYRGSGAKKAIDADPFADNERAFYCSSFVVECYERACKDLGLQPVIEIDYRHVSPKLLQANLRRCTDWDYVGDYTVTDNYVG
jgi:hypothetical protein